MTRPDRMRRVRRHPIVPVDPSHAVPILDRLEAATPVDLAASSLITCGRPTTAQLPIVPGSWAVLLPASPVRVAEATPRSSVSSPDGV